MYKLYRVLMFLFLSVQVISVGYAQWPPERGPSQTPTPTQLAWQDMEYGAFICFSLNNYADLEWSDGTLSPSLFNPTEFDARSLIRTVKDAGMKYIVLVCKHHDGFCLWQTDTTEYSIKNSPYKNGKGDIVREFAEACKAEGIKFGIYLSIWDRHNPDYNDNPSAYIAYFKTHVRELLTRYGDVAEVWFDPAKDPTPPVTPHPVDEWGTYQLIKSLQPNAEVAIAMAPDLRWVGNEEGVAPETLQNVMGVGGKPYWYPAEADVPIRANWFWKTYDADTLKTEDQVVDIYHKTIGRGANLLLNVTVDRRGKFPEKDKERILTVGKLLRRNYNPQRNLLRGKEVMASGMDSEAYGPLEAVDANLDTYWKGPSGSHETTLEVELEQPTRFNRMMLQEMIPLGQQIESYTLEYLDGATWKQAAAGTTVGHKKIDRFPDVTTDKVRLTLRSSASPPTLREFGLYRWIDKPGDMNTDSRIDVNDTVQIMRNVVGLKTFTPDQFASADLNADGALTVQDVVLQLQEMLGILEG